MSAKNNVLLLATVALLAAAGAGCGSNPPCETDISAVDAARTEAQSAESRLEEARRQKAQLEQQLATEQSRKAELERKLAELKAEIAKLEG
jgi:septal ring factor EnvC (AmiA/AmiB activator)